MTAKELLNLRTRTDAKLRYAEIHLEELRACGQGGNDFERAHMESYFYHLIGSRDAFLVELIEYYSLGPINHIGLDSVKRALREQQKQSAELDELYFLDREDESGWFRRAKTWRDHLTHVGPIRHHFTLHVGHGAGEVQLQDPITGDRVERRLIGDWLNDMNKLLERLRESAIQSTGSHNQSQDD